MNRWIFAAALLMGCGSEPAPASAPATPEGDEAATPEPETAAPEPEAQAARVDLERGLLVVYLIPGVEPVPTVRCHAESAEVQHANAAACTPVDGRCTAPPPSGVVAADVVLVLDDAGALGAAVYRDSETDPLPADLDGWLDRRATACALFRAASHPDDLDLSRLALFEHRLALETERASRDAEAHLCGDTAAGVGRAVLSSMTGAGPFDQCRFEPLSCLVFGGAEDLFEVHARPAGDRLAVTSIVRYAAMLEGAHAQRQDRDVAAFLRRAARAEPPSGRPRWPSFVPPELRVPESGCP
jgi:hypothetical protein